MKENQKYPLVSIVLATFNGENYLPEQLDSIFAQTYPNIEVIAADDCSADGTLKILYAYAANHKNLQIIESSTNNGYIKNFEKAIAAANGELIAPCDQDDAWHLHKIELMVKEMENYQMLYCDSEIVDDKLQSLGSKLSDKKNLDTYTSCLVFATDNCVAGHATLFTKKLFSSASPFPIPIPHDWWLSWNATLNGGIKYINIPLVKYRNHAGNFIGAVKITQKKKTIQQRLSEKKQRKQIIKERVALFFEKCPPELQYEKKILKRLMVAYGSFSVVNNFHRVLLYLQQRKYFLAIKKCSLAYKYFFCIKMFFKIR